MPPSAPKYDLMLLLSPTATDEQRAKILADVEKTITTAGGEIGNKAEWGTRPMAYEISHQPDAEYHLLQFSAPGSLLESMSHNLRITDGVLRHRIIKILPGTPPAPSSPPPVVGAPHAAPQSHERHAVTVPAEPEDEE